MVNFPILKRKVNGRRLVYLDNAATTQKPSVVIDAVSNFYREHNANIHRGIHTLSQEATQMYEGVRDKVRKLINAKHREEIIFTSGTTEAINLAAWSWGDANIKKGDEILLTEMEHHSNLVPWQVLARKKEARLKFIPLQKSGKLDLMKLDKLITKKTKLVGIVHISNFLGTINPVEKIITAAHKKGAKVLIDGAQAGTHLPIDVQKLNCDFYTLSAHKMYGPTGVGVLYGKKVLLESMPPYQSGGEMIKKVSLTSSTYKETPYKFEAGTTNIAGVIGFGSAIDFITKIGRKKITSAPLQVTSYAMKELNKVKGLTIYGPNNVKNRGPIVAFTVKGVPPHDLASILDEHGVAVRTGHHCTMPAHKKLGVISSVRASFAIYNTTSDVDQLIAGIKDAKETFRV